MTALAGGHAAPSGELAALIEEQMKDDTYTVSRPNEVSLDAMLPSGDSLAELIGCAETGEIIDFTPRESCPVGGGQHGTLASYVKHGCRCEPCRKAKNLWQNQYRARKRGEAA